MLATLLAHSPKGKNIIAEDNALGNKRASLHVALKGQNMQGRAQLMRAFRIGENVIVQLTFAIILTLFGQPSPNNLVGKKAVEFSLPAVSGGEVALQSFRGKVVLLNFWATWCGPCREELPELDRVQEKFRKRGLAVVAVTVDNELENIRGFLKKYDLELQALWDRRKKVADAYKVEKMPSSYLIDRNGVIRFVHLGYSPEELKRIEAEIDEMLGKP
jgi:peroxiredoxin